MLQDINTATREELRKELVELESSYNEARFILSEAYQTMMESKEQYDKVKAQLNKMEGKK